MKSAAYWIERLNLEPHPEGGYFKEVYRSEAQVDHPTHGKERNLTTSIYFLLEGKDLSHFHELESDELWYFHDGAGALIHRFEQGRYVAQKLSPEEDGALQVIIPAGSQFAAEVINKEDYVLMGCVVSPGFDFEDFRMLSKEEMLRKYPEYKDLIEKFCLE